MPHLLVSTIVRHAAADRQSGFLHLVDSETGSGVRKMPIMRSAYRKYDDNPRGGLRGARGLAVHEDRLLVANSDTILVLDTSWKERVRISHPLLAGIHELLAGDDGIWVCSTFPDLLLRFSWDGELEDLWEWRLDRRLREALGHPAIPVVDRSLDYRNPFHARTGLRDAVHLNALIRSDGALLLLFGRILTARSVRRYRWRSALGRMAARLGLRQVGSSRETATARAGRPSRIPGSGWAVVRLDEEKRAEVLYRGGDVDVPNHNLHIEGERLVFNDSNLGMLACLDLARARVDRSVAIPGEPVFNRGLVAVVGGLYWVGSQNPAAVYLVDLEKGQVLRRIVLDGEPNETVFGLLSLPEVFAHPPEGSPLLR